jgi:ABC-type sulfate/molybdate transport systems ATPase subunit
MNFAQSAVAVDQMPRIPATDIQVEEPVRARVDKLSFFYGQKQALIDVSFPIHDRRVTALIGPSGCGKTTLLRAFNRMHDLYPGNRYAGQVILYPEGVNIVSPAVDPLLVRLKIGMVFQKPNPFPRRRFGTRSRTAFAPRPMVSPAASSSASVSRERWPPHLRCCCWTSRRRRSIPSQLRGSKNWQRSSRLR